MHSQKSLLFGGTDLWIKKDGDKDFAVTMGSSDTLYILHKVGEKYRKGRISWCRDDGLACFENTSSPKAEVIRKPFIKLFKNEFSLNIVSEANLKVANCLDLTPNLSTGKYKPYNKPDNKPLYVNVNSNHPPHIIKNLPESISQHIKLPSDKTVFNNSKQLFNNTLSTCRFDHKIMFQPLTENKDHSCNKEWEQKLYGSIPHAAVM